MSRIVRQRLAIRHRDVLLAVPPIHPCTPREIRNRILEYVLRRQIGLAAMLAEDAADEIEHRTSRRDHLAALMKQTPHRNARGYAAA